MKPLRFGIYAGIIWSLASLMLVAMSVLNGLETSWVELDFRPLTAITLLAADAAGYGSHFETLIAYAGLGMPINTENVVLCLVLAGADGFAAGVVIALVYNSIIGRRTRDTGPKALCFGVGSGVALGVSSFLLAAVAIVYGLGITEFDFTIRPVWIAFQSLPDFFPELRDSYVRFPADYSGAAAWGAWGFLDGLVWGYVIAYIFLSAKGYFRF